MDTKTGVKFAGYFDLFKYFKTSIQVVIDDIEKELNNSEDKLVCPVDINIVPDFWDTFLNRLLVLRLNLNKIEPFLSKLNYI